MFRSIVCLAMVLVSLTALKAGPPSESLFPDSTKGWIAAPNVDDLQKAYELLQLGEFLGSESMQPVRDDLTRQLDERLGARLGLKWADLDGVVGGEVAVGILKPDAKNPNSHALALVVDVAGKKAAADALVATATKTFAARKARRTTKKAGEAELTIFTLPPKEPDKPADVAVYCIHKDTLIVSDHEAVTAGMAGRIGVAAKDALGGLEAFGKIAAKVDSGKGTHVRWFLEPLGYAEASRAARGGKKERGLDPIKVLRKEGFSAVQGAGGSMQLHAGDHELVHRTYVYAPPLKDAKKGEKYRSSANMLDFPNGANLDVQSWVPNDISSYLTFNVAAQNAFDHLGPLYDAYMDLEGSWKEFMFGLKSGDGGPAIDVKKEIVDHLSGRVTVLFDDRAPVAPDSERVIVAVELKPGKVAQDSVLAGVGKFMERRKAPKLAVEGHQAWDLLEELDEEEARKRKPKSLGVLAVINGHLFFATHADALPGVLKPHEPADQLATAADLKLVRGELARLGSDKDSFRFFTRTDEAWRLNYELIAQDKIPVAETIFARVLNRLIPTEKKSTARKQLIDGNKLPEFAKAAPYLGPAGSFTQSDEEGWLTVGCLLKKSRHE